MTTTALPSNVHISRHPCLRAKLSQLRASSTTSKETNALIHDIGLIVGCEALAANLQVSSGGTVSSSPFLFFLFFRVPLTTIYTFYLVGWWGGRMDVEEGGACLLANTICQQGKTPLGYEYVTETIFPSNIALVPILRSGLGMLEGMCSTVPPTRPHTLPLSLYLPTYLPT